MTTFLLVRHAESYYNVNKTDALDSELTPNGVRQAKELALYLEKSKDADNFTGFVSPYKRCLDTAKEIRRKTGIFFRVFPLLAEYGTTWKEPHHIFVPRRNDEYWEFDWSMYEHGRLFTAETLEQFLERMQSLLKMALPEKTLIVSHGAVVYTIIDLLTDGKILKDGYGQVTNASVSLVKKDEPVYLFKNN